MNRMCNSLQKNLNNISLVIVITYLGFKYEIY
jgi:hypothetical protein